MGRLGRGVSSFLILGEREKLSIVSRDGDERLAEAEGGCLNVVVVVG